MSTEVRFRRSGAKWALGWTASDPAGRTLLATTVAPSVVRPAGIPLDPMSTPYGSAVPVRNAPRPDGITRDEAASILAVHVATVDRLIRGGVLTRGRRHATAQLSREQVEHMALTTRPVRRLVAGDYWLTRSGASAVLGVSGKRVQQLTEADRLPYEVHRESVAVVPAGTC